MRIAALAGGIGGSRFIRGLLAHLASTHPDGSGGTTAEVTVIGNTGDDIWVHGLRVCPDLDTVMYTLGAVSAQNAAGGARVKLSRQKLSLPVTELNQHGSA